MTNALNAKLKIAQSKLPQKIDGKMLLDILFEMNRYFDKEFTVALHNTKVNLDQNERNRLRKYYYYGSPNFLNGINLATFERYSSKESDGLRVLDSFITRCEKYDERKIAGSVMERYRIVMGEEREDNSEAWLAYYNAKRKKLFDFSLFVFDYAQSDFAADDFSVDNMLRVVADIYDRLENYRHFIFKLNGKLFNKNGEDVTWRVLYKIGIFCENFIQFQGNFAPFKKREQIEKLAAFLDARFENQENKTAAENFYSSISCGFKFEDCLVSENQETIVLSFQKIALDAAPVPCPACMTTIQSCNSYPELLMKSYECKNPNCPERSKSGRGKRFDEYGVYRYFKLVENDEANKISDALYAKWRKDVFANENDVSEMLARYYAWKGETVCVSKRIKIENAGGRKIVFYKPCNNSRYNTRFDDLPICKFFDFINASISARDGGKRLTNDIEIVNADSTVEINNLARDQIGAAITSPPYYNAREYSQWSNLLFYLVDMMRNAKAVFHALSKNNYYLYNIGDVVSADNIYVASNMSRRRLPLGFLSSLIFEKAGFNLAGNIIWNKGEVQSKRNSTMNHNSGYVKCINCYEHVLVFKKGAEKNIVSDVKKITPVIKINSKGENLYKHTAPYPMQIVELIKPFAQKDKYVLDPFLGSGTTLEWCKRNHFKGVGFEMNKEYFELAKKNINAFNELEF